MADPDSAARPLRLDRIRGAAIAAAVTIALTALAAQLGGYIALPPRVDRLDEARSAAAGRLDGLETRTRALEDDTRDQRSDIASLKAIAARLDAFADEQRRMLHALTVDVARIQSTLDAMREQRRPHGDAASVGRPP